MPVVTILNEQKIVYVHTPKVASMTLIDITHTLAGIERSARNPRKIKMARKKHYISQLSRTF